MNPVEFRPWMIRMWLIDHGADWASRAGDFVCKPLHRLESYCNFVYWNDYNARDRREYGAWTEQRRVRREDRT